MSLNQPLCKRSKTDNFLQNIPVFILISLIQALLVNGLEGRLYLSPIKDLFNGEIIAYDLARTPNLEQIAAMLKQALAKLTGAKPILYSDQGWQYQMASYQAILKENGIVQSMSRKGNYLDNSVMESFFGRLKTECYFGKRFKTFEQLEQTIHAYIHYYNHERIQVKLKGLSPVEYRTQSLN